MTVVAVASVKGAPGVTTAALAMANSWPKPQLLVAECDVSGGSISTGYLRGSVPTGGGLLAVAVAARRDLSLEVLYDASAPLSPDGAGVRLLQGLSDPGQARTVGQAGARISAAFRDLGRLPAPVDVLADCGRLGAAGFPSEVLTQADVVAVVVRPVAAQVLPAAHHVRRLRELTVSSTGSAFGSAVGSAVPGPRIGIVLVGRSGYPAEEVERHVGAPIWGCIEVDAATAAFLDGSGAQPRSLARSPLMTSASDLARRLLAHAPAESRDAPDAGTRDREPLSAPLPVAAVVSGVAV